MKLEKFKLKNFRCYKNEVEIQISDLTCLIGRNDVGKSSILEALDAFFNENIEKEDLAKNGHGETVELTCFFSNIPSSLVLDASSPTSPRQEGILNQEGFLEVKKAYTFGSRMSKAVYLNGYHQNHPDLADLLTMKKEKLKSFASEKGIDLNGANLTINASMREKIRAHYPADFKMMLIKVDGNLDDENNLKKIWASLKKYLPIYSLFKVDKPLSDKDKDVQDPMKIAIQEALAIPDIREKLEVIEEKIREKSTEVADKTIEKLEIIDRSLAEKMKSEFSKSPTWEKIFDLTLLNEENIPLNKRGSGIRRLVLLSFFQAQAERRKSEYGAPGIIYGLEEPETSQHPHHQFLLIDALKELSEQENFQVLFTTHSSNLVREIPLQSLRHIKSSESEHVVIEAAGTEVDSSVGDPVIDEIIETLGILPNPTDKIKVLVYVEGNNDVNALKRFSRILNGNDPNILNLESTHAIGFVIAGGSSLKFYVENKYLQGLGKPEVHIYDGDIPDYVRTVNKINSERNPKKIGFYTIKKEFENYLHEDAINEAYSNEGLGISMSKINDSMDVPVEIAKLIYGLDGKSWDSLDKDGQSSKSNEKKKFLNSKAVDKMTIERINDRNGYEEITSWLSAIKQFI